MILFGIYVVPFIKPQSILQSYKLLLYRGEKPRCLQLPADRALPGDHQNYAMSWFHLQRVDAKKKPAGSSLIRSLAACQDRSGFSPLAEVRVNVSGFALPPPPRVGNWVDGTSPSPLDKPWGWPQRSTSQGVGAHPSCHCRAGDAQWEAKWLGEGSL